MSKIIQLKNKEGESLFPIGSKSGENANGNWIKFSDGRMICSNRLLLTNTAINTARGQLFSSAAITLPNFPVAFIEIPDITITMSSQGISGTRLFWVSAGTSQGSATVPPAIFLGSSTSTSANETVGFWVSYQAIGRWK